jgi:transposase
VFPNPKHYKANLEKFRRLSKKFSRKTNGSNNRHKSKIQLAKHHARVANLRKNTIHQITTFLCKNHAKIVVEDLNVSGMLSKDATFSLNTQVNIQTFFFYNQMNQRLRLMSVQAVHNQIPFFGIRVSFNRATNMKGKINFCSCISAGRLDNLTSSNIKTGN